MKRGELWAAIHDERALLVSTLRDLTPDQWDAPSRSEGWRVRDVVGHLCGAAYQYRRYTLPIIGGTVRSGFRLNRFVDRDARVRGAAPVDALVTELEQSVTDRHHPWPAFPLAETIVHGQDIRLPLGLSRTFPTERLIVVADLLRWPIYPPVWRKLTRGLRLEATDADWTRGRGPVLRGPLASLVLTMAGRSVNQEELEGEGASLLAARQPTPRHERTD